MGKKKQSSWDKFIQKGKCKNCGHAIHRGIATGKILHNNTNFRSKFMRCNYRDCGCRRAEHVQIVKG